MVLQVRSLASIILMRFEWGKHDRIRHTTERGGFVRDVSSAVMIHGIIVKLPCILFFSSVFVVFVGKNEVVATHVLVDQTQAYILR